MNKTASVILPTSNRYHVVLENIKNIKLQSYSPLEIVVCDDSDREYYKANNADFLKELANLGVTKYFYVARFDHDGNKDYGLARARNFGVVEASGEYLIFLDDRITPAHEDMVAVFVRKLEESKSKVWYFGDKGAQKQSFVENCSAIRRSHIVDAGLFMERIDKYGGMSRELIGRFTRQSFRFVYVPEAKAKQVCKSSGWDRKPAQIEEMKKLLEKLFAR